VALERVLDDAAARDECRSVAKMIDPARRLRHPELLTGT
jgi:hypothetical protein